MTGKFSKRQCCAEGDELAWKQARFDNIIDSISDITGVTAGTFVSEGHAKELYLDVDWDTAVIELSRQAFAQALRDYEPSVNMHLFRFSAEEFICLRR